MATRTLDEQNKLNKKNEQVFIDAGAPYENVTDQYGQTYQTYGKGMNAEQMYNTYGKMASDSQGGMFDKNGNSNTDDYLLKTIGLSRDQINQSDFLSGLSDIAIETAYNQTQPWATSLYYNPNKAGMNASNAKEAGSISIDAIQQELAKVAGWTPYEQTTFAPVIGPTGYNASSAALANGTSSNSAANIYAQTGGSSSGAGSTRTPSAYPTSSSSYSSSSLISYPSNGSYTSPYQEQLNNLLAQIQDRGEFKYDFNADPIYQQYKDRYTQAGKLANLDAQAGAAALTGGYGNSWAQTVGQQQEQQYLQQLNDVIPDLYDYNYNLWNNQNDWLIDQLGLYQDLDNTEYQRYLDQREWEYQLQQAALAAAGYGSGSGSSHYSSGGGNGSRGNSGSASDDDAETKIINQALAYANTHGKVTLDSRTLDKYLSDNGITGKNANLFKGVLQESGSTVENPRASYTGRYTTASGTYPAANSKTATSSGSDKKKKNTGKNAQNTSSQKY